jgi:hypothetical protein
VILAGWPFDKVTAIEVLNSKTVIEISFSNSVTCMEGV